MRDWGYEDLPLSRIKVPGDFGAYTKAHQAEVDELSGARKALLLAHAPTVDKVTMTLIAGRRRFAGLLNDGVKRTWVHLVEGTPAELRRLTASENLHRGHGDDLTALRVAYVDATVAEVEAERELADEGPRKAGRPVTAKGEARQRAAVDLGTTPEALRKAEARVAAKDAPDEPDVDDEPPVDMLGLTASWRWLTGLATVKRMTASIDQQLRQLQGQARYVPQPHQQRLYAAIHAAAAVARSIAPAIACVICRDPDGTLGKRTGCLSCAGLGWMTADGQKGLHPSAMEAKPAPSTTKRLAVQVERGGDFVAFDESDPGPGDEDAA